MKAQDLFVFCRDCLIAGVDCLLTTCLAAATRRLRKRLEYCGAVKSLVSLHSCFMLHCGGMSWPFKVFMEETCVVVVHDDARADKACSDLVSAMLLFTSAEPLSAA